MFSHCLNYSFGHFGYLHSTCRQFNLTMIHGYVPNQFGRGISIPLVKDKHGDLNNSNNYRAITISPVISKIFESCVLSKYEAFLFINDLQFGFKKYVGCGHALFSVQYKL